ncbi:VWD domain-containing protein [Flectobacillus major]|uniref:VWD domain-containing protein n=1 Tax=Flectobacillus major TaxID=103 RepID=UPI00040F06F6|nr:VWD domain-containing protein [Flectobacillus major]
MKSLSILPLCLLLVFIAACSKKVVENPTPTAQDIVGVQSAKSYLFENKNSTVGLIVINKEAGYTFVISGNKTNSGRLKSIKGVMAIRQADQRKILYWLDNEYRLSNIIYSTGERLVFSNYNLAKSTVDLQFYGYSNAQYGLLAQKQGFALTSDYFQLALSYKQITTMGVNNFPSGRIAAPNTCNDAVYNAVAGAYIAAGLESCAGNLSSAFGGAVGTILGKKEVIDALKGVGSDCGKLAVALGRAADGKPAIACGGSSEASPPPCVDNAFNLAEQAVNGVVPSDPEMAKKLVNALQENCDTGGGAMDALADAACQCNPDDKDIPEENKPANSAGDPHIRTLDGLGYSFQGFGEFIATKASNDNLEIQVRQQPWQNSTNTLATVNTALAIRLNNDIVSVYVNPAKIIVNGQVLDNSFTTKTLTNKAYIAKNSYEIHIVTGNKDEVVIRPYTYHLDYLVSLNSTRKGKVNGILGNFDGNTTNDLQLSNGKAISYSFGELYPSYADSWRIQQSNSLFVYDAGKNTDSYTNKAFPQAPPSFLASQQQQATNTCKAAGISEEPFLSYCVYDVLVTGDNSLVKSAKWAMEIEPTVVSAISTDLTLFQNVRIETGSSQKDTDALCALDLDNGKVYSLATGVGQSKNIDLLVVPNCNSNLMMSIYPKTCGSSCGTSVINQTLQSLNWQAYKTGQIRYLDTSNPANTLALSQWNNIHSPTDISNLVKVSLNASETFTNTSVFLDASTQGNACKPSILQNQYLYAFITQEGKKGVFRITGTGDVAGKTGARWFMLDIKIQK